MVVNGCTRELELPDGLRIQAVPESEVIRVLHLDQGRPNRSAVIRALDRLWFDAQQRRQLGGKSLLTRTRAGRIERYIYSPATVRALIEELSVR